MKCPNCNNNIPDGSKFCNRCGQRIEDKREVVLCSTCGKEIPSDSMYCPFCGNKQSVDSLCESAIVVYSVGDNCSIQSGGMFSKGVVRLKIGKNVIGLHSYPWIEDGFTGKVHCEEIKSFDLSGYNTSNVQNMTFMFSGCSSLESLDLSSFDTSNVKRMSLMFARCSSLEFLNLSGFNTTNVQYVNGMFDHCKSLKTLDLSGFDTSNMREMRLMFSGCSSLKSLDLSGFDTSQVEDMSEMFLGCDSLETVILKNCADKTIQMISQALDDEGICPRLITY